MPQDLLSIDDLLEQMVARGASDLHLSAGAPPTLRVRGEMIRLEELGQLMPADTQQLLYRVLSSEQQKRLEIDRQLDLSHAVPGLARFRVNVYFQRESLGAAFRQDPDVILLGEMRDLETIATALTAAETGHLVFGTLHTQSAPRTIDRVIDVFPAEQQEQVRVQIAATLQGVVTQSLLPTADGQGRVAACEVLIPDDAVRNLIRQGKVEQVYSVMQTATSRGMQTLEQALAELVLRGVVTLDVARSASSRRDQLEGLLERAGYVDPNAGAE